MKQIVCFAPRDTAGPTVGSNNTDSSKTRTIVAAAAVAAEFVLLPQKKK